MPDASSLYPQLQPQQQNSLLNQNPLSAVQTIQNIRGQIIDNSRRQFDLDLSQNNYLRDLIGTYASKDNVSRNDVYNAVVNASRNVRIPSATYIGILEGMPDDSTPRGKAALKQWLADRQAAAIGSTGLAGVSPASRYVQSGPNGEVSEQPVTVGQAIREMQGAASGPTGGVPGGPNGMTKPPLYSEQSGKLMYSEGDRLGTFSDEMAALDKAQHAIEALGPGGTGKGSKDRQHFGEFLYSANPTIAKWLGIDPERLRTFGNLDKTLSNIQAQRAQQLGGGSNERAAPIYNGTPNTDINDMTNYDQVRFMKALRRAEQARHIESMASGPNYYSGERNRWNLVNDPLAYGWSDYTKDEKKRLLSSLSGRSLDKFNYSLKNGVLNGLIDLSSSEAQKMRKSLRGQELDRFNQIYGK